MSSKSIRGSVNVALLDKADRLFCNNDEGIWIEVLQNARRAGATRIAIAIEETSPDGDACTVTVEDNGRGITDFQALVTLGYSRWTEETTATEDPAGMGFFSLCHSAVEVHSGDECVRISREVFLGKSDAEIEKRKDFVQGTRLRFQRPSAQGAGGCPRTCHRIPTGRCGSRRFRPATA
jgi:Histidine kinase-, DNA gyrase B-, and HSP90-like ATPase